MKNHTRLAETLLFIEFETIRLSLEQCISDSVVVYKI